MKDADSHFSALSSKATVPITSFEPKRRLSSSRSTLLRPSAAHDYQQNTRSSVAHLHYGAGLRRQRHLLAAYPLLPPVNPSFKKSPASSIHSKMQELCGSWRPGRLLVLVSVYLLSIHPHSDLNPGYEASLWVGTGQDQWEHSIELHFQ